MSSISALETRNSDAGPGFLWAIPIGVLSLFAFVDLFSFAPVITTLSLVAVAFALLMRFLTPLLALACLLAIAAAQVSLAWYADLRKPPENPMFGTHSFVRFPLNVAPWVNVAHFNYKRDPKVELENLQGGAFAGDVVIRSRAFERASGRTGDLRCDWRCVMLLRDPAVTSVTIDPQARVWREGPRALMPGYVPKARTFRINPTSDCREIWRSMPAAPPDQIPRDGAGVEEFHKALRRETRCLISSPALPGRSFDATVIDAADG